MKIDIELLGSLKDEEKLKSLIGKTIENLVLEDNKIYLTLDGKKFTIYDDMQLCCEYRYIDTDDNIKSYVGSTILDIGLKGAYKRIEEWTDQDIAFLKIQTTVGVITFNTYNEHNGYYGGIYLSVKEQE